jgi:hypothetical protein
MRLHLRTLKYKQIDMAKAVYSFVCANAKDTFEQRLYSQHLMREVLFAGHTEPLCKNIMTKIEFVTI